MKAKPYHVDPPNSYAKTSGSDMIFACQAITRVYTEEIDLPARRPSLQHFTPFLQLSL